MLLVLLLLSTAACAGFAVETGYASWYGGKFQGRLTANGETFDTNKLTAAHKTLPFDTIVEVTNLKNGKSVRVRINDRGPFVEGRIIDLSRAAADAIGMAGAGIAPVSVKIIGEATAPRETPNWRSATAGDETRTIQVASFKDHTNAQDTRALLRRAGLDADYERPGDGITRVVIERIPLSDLDGVLDALTSLGYGQVLVRVE